MQSRRTQPSGSGRKGAIAAVTPQAPAAGPPQPCGVEKVLCRLKWQTIEARLARARDAQEAVGVGLVIGAEPAGRVDEVDEFHDARIEDARVLRVGDEQRGGALGDGGFQRFEIGIAIRIGMQGDDLVPCDLGGRGIRRDARRWW